MSKYKITTPSGKTKVVEAESFDDAVAKTFSEHRWIYRKKGEKGYNKPNIKVAGAAEKTVCGYNLIKLRYKRPKDLMLYLQVLCAEHKIGVAECSREKGIVSLTVTGGNGLAITFEAKDLPEFKTALKQKIKEMQKSGEGAGLADNLVSLSQQIELE